MKALILAFVLVLSTPACALKTYICTTGGSYHCEEINPEYESEGPSESQIEVIESEYHGSEDEFDDEFDPVDFLIWRPKEGMR